MKSYFFVLTEDPLPYWNVYQTQGGTKPQLCITSYIMFNTENMSNKYS